MTVVITSVGTSLFTNGARENAAISGLYDAIKDERAYNWDNYNVYIDDLRRESGTFIDGTRETASAELQSTSAIQNELNDDIIVHLIASDTISSRLAAEILKDELPNHLVGVIVEFDPVNDVIQGLCATDPSHFEVLGVPTLHNRLNQICDNLQDNQQLAINITGGYAATVSILTLFAKEKECPVYYNFEETPVLIEIFRLFP